MKLEELLKPITVENEINLDDFCKWFNHWVNDLYFCSSEEEVLKIQRAALKSINEHDEFYIKRLIDERQKYFMDLGVWNPPRMTTVLKPIRDDGFMMFSFLYHHEKFSVAITKNEREPFKVYVSDWSINSIIRESGKTSITIDDARILISTLINNRKYLPHFTKRSYDYKLFLK